MRKKFCAAILLLGMILSLCLPAAAANQTAAPSNNSVFVDGKAMRVAAYKIDGNNYFKLRDIAAAVNGSEKQFEVTWDQGKQAITITPRTAYTTVGGELSSETMAANPAALSTAKVYQGDIALALTGYNIKGNNYYKLRDVANTLDIGIQYDEATGRVDILTTEGYRSPEQQTEAPEIEGASVTFHTTLQVDTPDGSERVAGITVVLYKAHRAADRTAIIEYKVAEGVSGSEGLVSLSWEVSAKDAESYRGTDQYYAVVHPQTVNGISYRKDTRFVSIERDNEWESLGTYMTLGAVPVA